MYAFKNNNWIRRSDILWRILFRINTNINVDNIDIYRLNSESMKNLNKSVEKLAQVMIDAIGKDTF